MNSPITGIVIGGLMPALILGVFGVMQKTCMRAGRRTGIDLIEAGNQLLFPSTTL